MPIRIANPMFHTAGRLTISTHNVANGGQTNLRFTDTYTSARPIQEVTLFIQDKAQRDKLTNALPAAADDPTHIPHDACPSIFGIEQIRIEWTDQGLRLHLNDDELKLTFFGVKRADEQVAA